MTERVNLHRLAAMAVFFGGAITAHAAPDAQLLTSATAAQPAVVETLKTMVSIESGSADLEGLAKLAALLDERLKSLGFKTERRKAVPGAGADRTSTTPTRGCPRPTRRATPRTRSIRTSCAVRR